MILEKIQQSHPEPQDMFLFDKIKSKTYEYKLDILVKNAKRDECDVEQFQKRLGVIRDAHIQAKLSHEKRLTNSEMRQEK